LLADLVVLVHLAFIVFGLLGGLLTLWKGWLILCHLPAAVWIALIEFQGWICPLTPLENRLRQAAGEDGYSGGFVEHYVVPLIYPEALTREIQLLLGVLAITVNLAVYGYVLYRRRGTGR
jgi:hypothetical protein